MTFRYPGTIRASFSFYNTKEEIDVMVEAVKEQHSCCLNNLNDENTIFTTIDCFLGKSCVGQNKQDLESAVIEYTANSRGFYQKITIQNQMVKKIEVEKPRPWLQR
jgi:uncharacterized protein YfcZ (UPF0381/DUF406 family)